jgi:hypothetical protein
LKKKKTMTQPTRPTRPSTRMKTSPGATDGALWPFGPRQKMLLELEGNQTDTYKVTWADAMGKGTQIVITK